jgi:hypothetical protein
MAGIPGLFVAFVPSPAEIYGKEYPVMDNGTLAA